eukprot:scaffold1277_cov253-Pinguiococcus_pyrenoidosus.AAC.52
MPAHAADLDRERVAGAQHGSGFPTDDAAGKVRPRHASTVLSTRQGATVRSILHRRTKDEIQRRAALEDIA